MRKVFIAHVFFLLAHLFLSAQIIFQTWEWNSYFMILFSNLFNFNNLQQPKHANSLSTRRPLVHESFKKKLRTFYGFVELLYEKNEIGKLLENSLDSLSHFCRSLNSLFEAEKLTRHKMHRLFSFCKCNSNLPVIERNVS